MQVSVVDVNTGVQDYYQLAEFSEFSNDEKAGFGRYDYMQSYWKDSGVIVFANFFAEKDREARRIGGYLSVDSFVKQVEAASKKYSDYHFQLLTFNVNEQNAFSEAALRLGFECIGDSPGNHDTPIYLYVKVRSY